MRYIAVAFALVCTAEQAYSQPVRYKIVDLTEVAQPLGVVQCEGLGVNDAGQIVGFELLPEFKLRAIIWDTDLTPSFLPPLPGDNSTIAHAITEAGEPIGASDDVQFVVMGQLIKIFQNEKAVRWTASGPVKLSDSVPGGPPMNMRDARAINSQGVIVGWGDIPGPGVPALIRKGYVLDNGSVTETGELSRPTGINSPGLVVGYATLGQDHAFQWQGGVATDLHHPSLGGVTSRAWDVNDAGLIVGEAQFHISKPEEAALWVGGVPQRLIPEINRPQGVASDILNDGTVLGYYSDLDNINDGWHGFTWKNGKRIELLETIDHDLGWQQLLPAAISESGIIVGGGVRNGTLEHGFAMFPLCYADCDKSGSLDFFDFLCFQNEFANTSPFADCDEDGSHTFFDFLCFQNAFAGGCT